MATSNHERVGKALDLLNKGLRPFAEREMRAVHGENWLEVARSAIREDRGSPKQKGGGFNCDTQALLTLVWEQWNGVYADSWDVEHGRYRGLRAGNVGSITFEGDSLLVKPEVAARQIAADRAAAEPSATGPTQPYTPAEGEAEGPAVGNGEGVAPISTPKPKARRFHGTVDIDPGRVGRDAGNVAEAVVQHLAGLVGSTVQVTLEVRADIPAGAPDNVVRTVTENCNTLRFRNHGFEEE